MAALIVSEREKQALVAGLGWQKLGPSAKSHNAEIRQAARETEATHALVVQHQGVAAVGLISQLELDADFEQSARRKKKLHSLAAAFSRIAGDGFAVLLYTVDSGEVALVVCESGVPAADDVKSADDARSVAREYAQGALGFAYTVYCNDPGLYPDALEITGEQLWACVSRHTALGSIPLDIKKLLGSVLLVGLVVAGAIGWQQYSEQQRRLKLQQQALMDDPVPKYQEQLMPALARLGMERAEVARLLRTMGTFPVAADGWLLREVQCSLELNGCLSSWTRAGGTTDGLLRARSAAGDRLIEGAAIDLNSVSLTRETPVKLAGVGAVQDLRPIAEVKLATASFAQGLDNLGAKMTFESSGYARWPKVAGLDMASLPASSVVQAVSLQIEVEAALAQAVVDSLPGWIWIRSLKASIDATSDKPIVTLVMSGMSYAR